MGLWEGMKERSLPTGLPKEKTQPDFLKLKKNQADVFYSSQKVTIAENNINSKSRLIR